MKRRLGAAALVLSFSLLGREPAALAQPKPAPAPSVIPTPPGGVPETAPLDADDRIWTPASNGLRESRVTAIAANPAQPQSVIAATTRGAVYRSTDGGRSWSPSLRVPDRGRGDTAGGGEDSRDAAERQSDPDGLSDEELAELEELREETFQNVFDELTEVVGPEEAERIAEEEADTAVDERREELVEQAAEESAGGAGEEGEEAPPSRNAAVRQVVWDPAFPGLVYLATHDGVWRSGDSGGTWVQLSTGVGPGERDVTSVAPSAGDPDRILLGTGGGVRISDDGGLTWSDAAGEPGSTEVRVLAVDPENRSVIAAGTIAGGFVSTDGGRSWRKVWSGVGASGDVRTLAFRRGDETGLFVGTGDGLHLVTPEGSRAIGIAQFSSSVIRAGVAPRGDTSHVYVATSRSVHESLDGGRTFAELYRGLSTPNVLMLAEEHSNPDSVWAATALGVFRLLPEGALATVTGKVGGPSLSEMVRAAERYDYLDRDRLAGWQRDARIAKFIPRVTFFWRRGWDDDVETDVTEIRNGAGDVIGHERIPSLYDNDRNEQWYLTLTWRFDQVLQGTDRSRMVALSRTLTAQRSRKLAEVIRLARERRDVAGRLAATPPDSQERVALEVRFQELTGYLDGATGGALSRFRSSSKKPAASTGKPPEEAP